MKKSLSLLAGAAVLAVAAVPAVGQSAGKLAPKQVTRKTTPSVGHTYPWKFTTKGKIVLPKGTCPAGTTDTTYCTPTPTKAQGCKGKVQIFYKLGTKVLSKKKTGVTKSCTYSGNVTFRNKTLAGKRLTVQSKFLGNSVLLPKSSSIRRLLLPKHSKGL